MALRVQQVLDRVSCMQDKLTTEERQVVQDAQMMKDLAEEVMTANFTSKGTAIKHIQPQNTPLTLCMSTLTDRQFEPTEAPPPTATTPPPTAAILGHSRHSSSATSLASSSHATDGQYTHNSQEQPSSRLSSVSSSHRRHQSKKSRLSLRQLQPLNSNQGSSRQDEESNAAFERICSLLTHLITDASTAVSTAPDGSHKSPSIPLPQFSPLIQSDSELSADSVSDNEDASDNDIADKRENLRERNNYEAKEIDFLKRLQGPEGAPCMDELELEVEVEPVRRYRSGLRVRQGKSTKRLSSLFLELQNTQQLQNDDTMDEVNFSLTAPAVAGGTLEGESNKERTARKQRPSTSSVPDSSSNMDRLGSVVDVAMELTETHGPAGTIPRTPATISQTPTTHASKISCGVSLPQEQEILDGVEQQSTESVESDLDRTVETIDGLTRELVAVAARQNWMQMKLQKTLQFQKQQVEKIERAHSAVELGSSCEGSPSASLQSQINRSSHDISSSIQNPLVDLSRSLKQVAVSVGRVLANSVPKHKSENQKRTGIAESSPQCSASQARRFSGKDFSHYFQELEKVAALGGKIGFGKVDENDSRNEDAPRELQNQDQDHDRHRPNQSWFSESSYATVNSSSRNSAASTLVVDGDMITPLADYEQDPAAVDGEVESNKNQTSTSVTQSRRGSTCSAPELEDFAAQCRLLTRALVLPFVQLTHHAMTSQDSALALTPRTSKFVDPSRELDSTLELVHNLERREDRFTKTPSFASMGYSSSSLPRAPILERHQKEPHSPSSQNWNAPLSVSSPDLDSILKSHGELSPDAIVKVKTFISTGLYLIHLLYWTVLFIIGTLVLDPWLAETAGQQVVKIMDQVRETIAKDRQSHVSQDAIQSQDGDHLEYSNLKQRSDYLQGQALLVDNDNWNTAREETGGVSLEPAQFQALEDRAFEVAIGFESLRQRLSSPVVVRPSNEPVSGLWSRDDSYRSTTSAMTEASSISTLTTEPMVMTKTLERNHDRPASMTSLSTTTAAAATVSTTSGASVLRTVSWVGPRRRRPVKDGNPSKSRRFSNTRTMNVPVHIPKMAGTGLSSQSVGVRRDRPLSHWGFFGQSAAENTFSPTPSFIPSSTSSSTTLSKLALQDIPFANAGSLHGVRHAQGAEYRTLKYTLSRRKSL
ncbi:hypothetical protein BGX28_005555 [Mortierella sp. GBA30]|nr:hypothetical protein BGX28_005555 [Mortierella sp. GBA30]